MDMNIWLVILPVLVPLVSELVSWVNVKLNGTPLNGQGAFWTTVGISALGGLGYAIYNQLPANYVVEIVKYGGMFLAGSQIVFWGLMNNFPSLKFGSNVPTPTPTPTPTPSA